MPRARDPNRDKAFEIFKEHNGDITNRKIAEMLDCPEKSVGGWKSKDKWNQELNGVLQTNERSTPKKSIAKKKTKKATEIEEVPLNENGELTDKQWLFCMYYIKYYNATKAYQKAYECDYRTANVNGSRLLVNASIREEVKRMQDIQAQTMMLDANSVLQKWVDIAFADIGDYIKFGKYSVSVKNLEEVDTSLITEASNTEDGVKIKLADKMKALEFLSKHRDLLGDNELKRLKEEKLKADIAKTRSETKGDSKLNIQTLDMSNLSTEELRAIANSKR